MVEKFMIAEVRHHFDQCIWDPTEKLVRVKPDNRWQAPYWHHTSFEKTCRISNVETAQAIFKKMDAACNEGTATLVTVNDDEVHILNRW